MKTQGKFILGLLFATILAMSAHRGYGQCDAAKFKDKGIAQLTNGFTYKHAFELTPKKMSATGEAEFTYIFNKGTLYMMNMANSQGVQSNIIIEVYNPDRKLVATNYDSRTGKFWPIGYACNESGVHYIKFRFKDSSDFCGISVLGERK